MTTTKKCTAAVVDVPVALLRGLIKTIRADMKFQPGLAVAQWVDRLEKILTDSVGK